MSLVGKFFLPMAATIVAATVLFVARQVSAMTALQEAVTETSDRQVQYAGLLHSIQTNQAVVMEMQRVMLIQMDKVFDTTTAHGKEISALQAKVNQ